MAPYNTLRGTSPDFIDEFYKFLKGILLISGQCREVGQTTTVRALLPNLCEICLSSLVNQYTKGAGKRARFKP